MKKSRQGSYQYPSFQDPSLPPIFQNDRSNAVLKRLTMPPIRAIKCQPTIERAILSPLGRMMHRARKCHIHRGRKTNLNILLRPGAIDVDQQLSFPVVFNHLLCLIPENVHSLLNGRVIVVHPTDHLSSRLQPFPDDLLRAVQHQNGKRLLDGLFEILGPVKRSRKS